MLKKTITTEIRTAIQNAWTDFIPPVINNLELIQRYCPETEFANLPLIISAISRDPEAKKENPKVIARSLFTGKNYQQVDITDSSFLMSYAMNYFEDNVKLHYYAAYMLRTCDAIDQDEFEDLSPHFITIRELDPLAAIATPQQKTAIELLKKAIFNYDEYIRDSYEEHILKKNLAQEIIHLLYLEWDKLSIPSRDELENGEVLLECCEAEIQLYAEKHYRDVDYLDGWFCQGFANYYLGDTCKFYYYGSHIRMLCNLLETDGWLSENTYALERELPKVTKLATTQTQQKILKMAQEAIKLL